VDCAAHRPRDLFLVYRRAIARLGVRVRGISCQHYSRRRGRAVYFRDASFAVAMMRKWHCSIDGCPRVTTVERHPNPRDRWMLDIILQDQDETVVTLNLCPVHAKEIFRLTDEWYERLKTTEKIIREQNYSN
jgi:hypothetical protein